MKLFLYNTAKKQEVLSAEGKEGVHLVYPPAYRKGDAIRLTGHEAGFYEIRLEDTLPSTLVYLSGKKAEFPIPFGVDRAGFSPRSFTGKRHLIEVRKACRETDVYNLALNPHDQTGNRGIYPHMLSNVTYADTFRNRIFPDRGLFAPRNVIDGILANESHRLYPHQSWGINRNKEARLTIEFGRKVNVESIRLAIRCEFPHDSYWTQASVVCSDDKEEIIYLEKTMDWQSFPLHRQGIASLTLCNLIKNEDPSEFPALSLMEIYGSDCD